MFTTSKTQAATLPRSSAKSAISSKLKQIAPMVKLYDNRPPHYNQQEPTYGAYTNNSLPRGPYLQYKYYNTSNYFNNDDNNSHETEFVGLSRIANSSIAIEDVHNNNYQYGIEYMTKTASIPNQVQDFNVNCMNSNITSSTSTMNREFVNSNKNYKCATLRNTKPINNNSGNSINKNKGCASNLNSNNNHNKSTNQFKYVTLADVLSIKSNGVKQSEGWALLCQSVQALQDLFLADTPSIAKIRPLVMPTSIQITSRGRVVFNIFPVKVNQVINKKYLSPEYITCLGEKINFNESDIEKMWIYSLGMTLQKTISSHSIDNRYTFSSDLSERRGEILTSLDHVILTMCESNHLNRASLMFLLDVISDYCKNHHLYKPFSHMVMDLFKEVVTAGTEVETFQNIEKNEGHKSDTDSGRSSDHGDLDVKRKETQNYEYIRTNANLRFMRPNTDKNSNSLARPIQEKGASFKTYNTIGYTGSNKPQNYLDNNSKKLLIIRKQRKRNEFRRNTIDVTAEHRKLTSSKSTNQLHLVEYNDFQKQIDQMNFNATSMPNIANITERNNENSNQNATSSRENGPEFIVKSNVPPKIIDLTDAKTVYKRTVTILLLNGYKINVMCNPATTTSKHVFEAILKSENLSENFFLGLCALIGGDFVFLPMDLKIYKVAPQIWINVSKKENSNENIAYTLYVRVKFFLPTLRGASSCLESRHLLYLQLRKSILERQILCTEDDLIALGGLALQAEVGSFKENMKYIEYFTISHYLPEEVCKNKELAKYLRSSHFSKKGLHTLEAEHNFIRHVQELKEYGLHLYSASWITDENITLDVYVAISLGGVAIFERNLKFNLKASQDECKNSRNSFQRHLYMFFDWLEIENICFSKHVFCISVRKTDTLNAKAKNRVKYKLRMDDRKSYFAFNLASEHHKFYMKLRNSFISIKALSSELNLQITEREKCEKDRKIKVDISEMSENIGFEVKNVEKIDKTFKTTGLRVRNLKKSMLNDNKLMKLRQRFLKRSKSVIESASLLNQTIINEESQNKENECPQKLALVEENPDYSPKTHSMNRNKVKMGTRVFSAPFLNKSFDNLYDDNPNNANLSQILNSYNFSEVDLNGHECINLVESNVDDTLSFKSSVGSIYYMGKIDETPLDSSPKAYVIHSSIKSDNINNFTLPNDTISDTLLEKFNDLSCSNDRILTQVTILKDSVSDKLKRKKSFISRSQEESILFGKNNKLLQFASKMLNDANDAKQKNHTTIGISIVQGSDNNVYVKELVANGPGERNGVRIGDQIIAVNGKSLLNLPYSDSLNILQNTGRTVELVLSQIYTHPSCHKKRNNAENTEFLLNNLKTTGNNDTIGNHFNKMKSFYESQQQLFKTNSGSFNEFDCRKNNRMKQDDDAKTQTRNIAAKSKININDVNGLSPSKSMPDLPKIIAAYTKQSKAQLPRKFGLSRRYIGPVRYPVTPAKDSLKTTSPTKKILSISNNSDDEQVFI